MPVAEQDTRSQHLVINLARQDTKGTTFRIASRHRASSLKPTGMSQVLKLLLILLLVSPSCNNHYRKQQTKPSMTTETDNLTKQTLAAVEKFNSAVNRHDLDAVMNAMTDDCVFENTNPPPDGGRFVGADAVRAFWQKFFDSNPDAVFEAEEIIATGNRCVVRWIYRKTKEGKPWHLRGVDVFRIRDGKVAEKLAYVKG